jgi:sulfate/thiosulfate transport system ATP-binding protein
LDVAEQKGKVAHVRPHDIEVQKAQDEKTAHATLKDWQHLGALMRIELLKKGMKQHAAASVFAEMPSDQFKQLQLNRGDHVSLKIRKAHWFH